MFKIKSSELKWGTVYELDVTDPHHKSDQGTRYNSRKLEMRNGSLVIVDLRGEIRGYCLYDVDPDIEHAVCRSYVSSTSPLADEE